MRSHPSLGPVAAEQFDPAFCLGRMPANPRCLAGGDPSGSGRRSTFELRRRESWTLPMEHRMTMDHHRRKGVCQSCADQAEQGSTRSAPEVANSILSKLPQGLDGPITEWSARERRDRLGDGCEQRQACDSD